MQTEPQTQDTPMAITLHPRIAELMASRICHDLISPVGAVNNGIELIEEMGSELGKGDALGLIASSVEQASSRLKCFRLAYGAAGSEADIDLKDIRETFAMVVRGSRNALDWSDAVGEVFGDTSPRGFMKVLLNVLMLAEECNPTGGEIRVDADGSGNLRVTVSGGRAGFREGAESAITGEIAAEELDARLVHAYLTGRFAQHYGIGLAHDAATEGELVFTMSGSA